MVDAYNAMDVLTNVALGQGFGIPILEAQACGTPVIVGDWTSMSELCFAGWKVAKEEALPVYHDFFDAFQWQATTAAIYDRLDRHTQRRVITTCAIRQDEAHYLTMPMT